MSGRVIIRAACVLVSALAFSAAAPALARADTVAAVVRSVALYEHPGGKLLRWVPTTTVFGSTETFAVLKRKPGWLQVTSDLLPNNTFAWVKAGDVSLRPDRYRVDVNLSSHLLRVERAGRMIHSFDVATGAAASPTPTGVFSISDKLRGADYSSAYGCCILALSGSQDRLPAGWTGGTRLAIHGGGGIGQSVSAGCLHASTAALLYLMRTLPLGTRVVIHR